MRPRKARLLWLFLLPALFCVLWPVWFTLTAALRSSDELVFLFGPALGLGLAGSQNSTWTLLPCWPTLQPILQLLLDSPEFFVMFGNNLVQTVPQVLGALLVATPAAWALARYSFSGRGLVWGLYLLLMILPFQVSMVPTFLVLRHLGLLDTHWAVILPGMFASFPVFFLHRGFRRIPAACLEAAHLDGANEWICFTRIGLPLVSRTIFAVMTLQFWECWNSMEQPLAFLRKESLWPLSLYLPQVTAENFALCCAASLVILLPPLLVFWLGSGALLSDMERGVLK